MIPYNPERYATGFGFLRIIFALRGTVIPHVFKSGMFWMTIVSHTLFHLIEFLMHYRFEGQPEDERELWRGWATFPWNGLESHDPGRDGLPRVNWEVGTASLTLCIFFLVFYTNSMHQRFQEFHSHVIGIGGRTMVWVGLVKMHLGDPAHDPSPAGARRASAGVTVTRRYSPHARDTSAPMKSPPDRLWNAVRHVLGAMQVRCMLHHDHTSHSAA